MHVVGQVIDGLLWLFIALLWVRFVVDWVQVFARSLVARAVRCWSLLEVRLLDHRPADQGAAPGRSRRCGSGSVALDLSFLIVMIGAYVLLRGQPRIFCAADLHGARVTDDRAAAGAIVRPTVLPLTIDEWVRSCR